MCSEKIETQKRIVFTSEYGVDIGAHVFPTAKYTLVYNKLLADNLVRADEFIAPRPAEDEDILLVHNYRYVHKLKTGTLSSSDIMALEMPYSEALVRAFWLCAGGTILASRIALNTGIGVHIGGGFHHAFPDHGEGFCVLNDVAIAARVVQRRKLADKVLVVDCDVHQGNGTAFIFSNDKNVFTFSIHQANNYPFSKPPGDLDINLKDGSTDDEYIGHLEDNLPRVVREFSPDIIIYVAGADPYEHDLLGGLALSIDGLRKRDEYVLSLAKGNDIPVVTTFAGGYAARLEDTVEIHFNTVKTALDIFGL